MRIIAVSTLRHFWDRHRDAEQPLKAWYQEARVADWQTPREIKAVYRHASVLEENRVVFSIAGNKYRLVVEFNYAFGIGYIRFIGRHAEYDRINAEQV